MYQYIRLTFGWVNGTQTSYNLAMQENHSEADSQALIGKIVTLLKKGDPPILSDWSGKHFCIINADQLALIEVTTIHSPTE